MQSRFGRGTRRFPRCPRGSRGGTAADHTLCSSQDRRATGSASAAPGAVAPRQRADRRDQSDARLSSGAWDIVRQGLRFLRQGLPEILAKRTDVLSPRMVRIVVDLASDWRQLDERIEAVTDEIETLAKSDDSCRRVMTVPGIGPIISSAMVAAIGSGAAFARGRDFSAWIGLVPKQMSTGDRTILGASPSAATATCARCSCKQPGSFCCSRRAGPSTASGSGSRAPLNACTLTCWPRLSPTSWRGSPGPCWPRSAAMKRASQRQQPNENAQVHQREADRSS